MAMMKLKELEVYYEIIGKGEPIVLIAGYSCDHLFWGSIVSALISQYQVIILDNRGVGQTKDAERPFTIEMMADDIMELCDALEISNPIIIGQSMGGAIAQTIAINYPTHIKKLIVINSVMKFNLVSQMALKNALALRKLNVPLDWLIKVTLPWIFSSDFLAKEDNIDAFKQAIVDNPYLQSLSNQERQLEAISLFDSTEKVHQIKIPTLIIASKNDLLTPVDDCYALAKNIDTSTFMTIAGGHSSAVENPCELSKVILKFLSTKSTDILNPR